MKQPILKTALAVACLVCVGTAVKADNTSGAVVATLPVDKAYMTRSGNDMTVGLQLDLEAVRLSANRGVVFTPYIVNGNDSVMLQPVGLYGRTRWIQYGRKSNIFPGGPQEMAMQYSHRPEQMDYVQTVPYSAWMNGAHVAVKADTYGCCRNLLFTEFLPLDARYAEFTPTFIYLTVPDIANVVDAVKSREISGRAYVDFPVNQTVIYPTYRNNTAELGKIIATIDSVKNDPDVTVESIFIKGTASPEGPYDNNVRLAKGRTEALKEYVRSLYNFPHDFIKTDFEPVDWDGLREYLQTCVLEHKDQILSIVNSDIEPFARNRKIQNTYPLEYKFLLDNIYPTLRHSDYRIEYVIRQFTTAEDIERVAHTNPAKLSLNEMLYLAQTYEPGTDEFNDVFEIAVRMFPDSPVANLNVATSAMERGDLKTAERFLPKAGDSAEALYARANYAFLTGNYAEAQKLYEQAAADLPEAADALEDFTKAGYAKLQQ